MPARCLSIVLKLSLVALPLLGAACAGTGSGPAPVPEDFPNVLSLAGAPDSARDLSAYAFSDLGAWHMFGLPDPVADSLPGAFPGPLLLAEGGVWLGRATVGLELHVAGEAVPLTWDPAAPHPSAFLPGRLRQELVGPGVGMTLDLVFASPASTLIRATLVNRRSEPLEATLAWTGRDFLLPVHVEASGGDVCVELPGRTTRVLVRAAEDATGTTPVAKVTADRYPGYRISAWPVHVPPGGMVVRYVLVTVQGGPGAVVDDAGAGESGGSGSDYTSGTWADAGWGCPGSSLEARFLADPEEVLAGNWARWSGWLARVLAAVRGAGSESGGAPDGAAADSSALLSDPDLSPRVAVKAVETLISNWRSPRGHLYHDGLFPSYAYRGFYGIWSWDSWKHARALALFAPDLARDQLRVMLDHQAPDGMIPDVIYVDSTENNWRDTKPPLAAWAAHGIFRATADTSFVAEVYPALLAYHRWWYRERDHDGNGLCEYGSTDGSLIAAAWESGMDNAVRFDGARMVRNGPDSWSMDQESVDLNAYLFAEKGYLADLAEAVGEEADAANLRGDADRLRDLIRSTHFDEETGYFYDVDLESKAFVRVPGPEGWIPLWAGVASRDQADQVEQIMTDSVTFAARVPFPTLAMNQPEFDPTEGYWRGPVWLDQAYFAVRGLERYGYQGKARELQGRLLTSPRGLPGDGPIYENYHPRTGEGLNAPHFSWSAAHLLLLLAEER